MQPQIQQQQQQPHHQQQQRQQQQQNLHLPNLHLRSGTPFASASTTSPNSSPPAYKSHGSDDDEYASLVPRKLTMVGGYGSTSTSTSTGTQNGTFTSNSVGLGVGSIQRSTINETNRTRRKLCRTRSDGFSFGSTKTAPNSNKSQHPLHNNNNNNYNSHVQKPPMSHSPRTLQRKPPSSKHGRSNSLSAAGPLLGILGGSQQRHNHRRTASNASSVGAASIVSEASFMSITADIRKSAFYGGVDQATGKATWHYPNQHIYVCTDNPELVVGSVYKVAVDEETFEEYHRQAEDRMWEEDVEDMEFYNPHSQSQQQQERCCRCNCHPPPRRSSPRNKKDLFGALPSNQFALAVDPNIYKRVLDEISQAQQMPCGLFFCGHHDDVDHPSIAIALVMMVIVFSIMGTLAFLLPA
jgi:hypothetical protein